MAKTVNKDIDIFFSLTSAERAFDKSNLSCQLIRTTNKTPFNYDYFIDRSKTAIKEWPNLYTLIKEK